MSADKLKPSRDAVIWAIDPFEKETRPSKGMLERLMQWVHLAQVDVQPVYVLSVPQDEVDFSMIQEDTNQYADSAKRAAKQFLADLGVAQSVLSPKIILSGSSSRLHEVKRLLDYADDLHSPWIVVSSHGRSGLNRLLFGSFAENLLHHATCPVLFLTHLSDLEESRPSKKSVLFPTDFSENSKLAFRDFMTFARRFESDVILYHSVMLPSIISPGWSSPGLPGSYFFEQEKWAKREAQSWLNIAQAHAVSARLIIKDDGTETKVGASILAQARHEGVQMVVMSSKSSAFESFLAGSTARDVFRANRYPVWIYGPRVFESGESTEIYQPASAI